MAERFSKEKGIKGFVLRLIRMKKDRGELALVKRSLGEIVVIVDTTLGLETKADVQRILQFQEGIGSSMQQLDEKVSELGGVENIANWTDEQFQQVAQLMDTGEAVQFTLLSGMAETLRQGPHLLIDNQQVQEFWKQVAGNRFQMEYDEFWSGIRSYFSKDPEVVRLLSNDIYRGYFQSMIDDGFDFRYITVTEVNDVFTQATPITVREVLYYLIGKSTIARDRTNVAAFQNCIDVVGKDTYRVRGMCSGDVLQKLLDQIAPNAVIDLGSFRIECCGDLVIKKPVKLIGKKAVMVTEEKGVTINSMGGLVKFEGIKFISSRSVQYVKSMIRVLEGAKLELVKCQIQGMDTFITSLLTSNNEQKYDTQIGVSVDQWAHVSMVDCVINSCGVGISTQGECKLTGSRIEFCKFGVVLQQVDSNVHISNSKIIHIDMMGVTVNSGIVIMDGVLIEVDDKEGACVLVSYEGVAKFEGNGQSQLFGGKYGILVNQRSSAQVLQNLSIGEFQKSGILLENHSKLDEKRNAIEYRDSVGKDFIIVNAFATRNVLQ
eukprot:TRINITY_DN5960_c0_g1_i2.p1 TRINITY_DN5960_c0_g1~~TRINITY_DN5960_c0_g1_i2.p1  ORF type:complete len:631 (-),score=61.44 TRINITY_DN5960_c0_g1_i2:1502-3142(-)